MINEQKFSDSFTGYKENFWESTIFDNKALPISLRNKTYLTQETVSDTVYLNSAIELKKLKIKDLFNENKSRLKTLQRLRIDTQIDFSMEDFENLKKIGANAKQKYVKKKIDDKKALSVENFFFKHNFLTFF